MTPAAIKNIADAHLDAWFAADAQTSTISLREHVAAAITEGLEREAEAYKAGAVTRQHEDTRRMDWLAKRSRYSSPSWGYHKGYHEMQVHAPGNWAPGRQDTAPDTNEDLRVAIDQAMSPAPAPIIHCAPGGDLSGCAT